MLRAELAIAKKRQAAQAAQTKKREAENKKEIEFAKLISDRREAFLWKVSVPVYRKAKKIADGYGRPLLQIDVITALVGKKFSNVRDAVLYAMKNGFGPQAVTSNGIELYEQIAKDSGLPEREIFSYFKSPEQLGVQP